MIPSIHAKALFSLLIAVLTSTLTACGWHLRGAMMEGVTLPPMQLQFQKASTDLQRDLMQILKSSGVEITDKADLILIIQRETQGRRVLSVDTSGRVSEYELQYELVFSLKKASGEMLISSESIKQERDYQFDEAAVLAKGEEQAKLFDFMRSMSIQSLMRQLVSVTSNMTDTPQAQPADAD